MKSLSPQAKRTLKRSVIVPRLLISKLHPLPDFLVIGGMKCGTTSLYNYMVQHPRIVRAVLKEVHFFSHNYDKGLAWYRSHFPILWIKRKGKHPQTKELITGEASPGYIFYPEVAERIYKAVPEVKVIAILRNPVDRAYSHYHHKLKNGREEASVSFEQAIEMEEAQPGKRNYLTRGKYVDQLRVWENYFPKEQMLILKSEDFFEDPSSTLQQVYKFLDLPAWGSELYKNRNPGAYSKGMSAATREHLVDYFKPYNQKLYDFLGRDLGWDK